MGVYEVQSQTTPGMLWHHLERNKEMIAAAYDPSRDLSPNLPTTCQESRGSMSSGSSSGLTSCCSFKTEEDYDCRDCGPEDRKSCLQAERQELKQEPPAAVDESWLCAGCGRRIVDKYYLDAVERRWHTVCLMCCHCKRVLDDTVTCFIRHGNIYCKKDYIRLFQMKHCGRCHLVITPSEMVMKVRGVVFHLHCFTCFVCQGSLNRGDTFGFRNGAVFCQIHYHELPPEQHINYPPDFQYHPHPRLGPHTTPPPNLPMSLPSPSPDQLKVPTSFFNGGPTPRQKGRPRKRKPKDLESMTANLDLNAESYLDVAFGPGTPGMGGGNGGHHQRTKRMRTSFKHHQLRTMKSYFGINHNPDAKDLKTLSQKTGLPKRVLQVWFQNARAKWRRLMSKQEAAAAGKSVDKCGESSSGSLEAAYHLPPHGSPHQYLSSSPLDCSS